VLPVTLPEASLQHGLLTFQHIKQCTLQPDSDVLCYRSLLLLLFLLLLPLYKQGSLHRTVLLLLLLLLLLRERPLSRALAVLLLKP